MLDNQETNRRILELEDRLTTKQRLAEAVLSGIPIRDRQIVDDYIHTLMDYYMEWAVLLHGTPGGTC